MVETEAAQARFGDGASPGGGAPLSEEEAESLAFAIRLQQEEDDAALRAVLGPAASLDDERDGAVSPSQYSYEVLMRLGEALGEVSKGAAEGTIHALRTLRCSAARDDASVRLGDQCSICRMEFEDEDLLRCLPCGHAEHTECLDAWLKLNRSCPLCQKDIA